ncbi:Nucleoporin NDC1 [Cyberlindnera fabianii]|uniref:Nucleoporin NDC1 n=1 Tax=Cyberlindnera fabianii TaxID=36022 RepID=A0A1V2LAB3_CYBFA|nr:Nucleoporin NDC1 [Cyberlindnera fabianii]
MSSFTTRQSASTNSAYHYHSIFGDICSTRFAKLARFILIMAWAATLITSLGSSKSWWATLLPLWALPQFIGFFLLTCLRKNNLHVDLLGYKTLASQVLGQLFNKKFTLAVILYTTSSLIYFQLVQSQFDIRIAATPKKHQYPPLNDNFVFYYYFAVFVAVIYSIQHSVFDRDRLVFTYGTFHAHPKAAIMGKIPKMMSNSIIFTVFVMTSAPLFYLVVRYTLYDITLTTMSVFYSLNNSYPSLAISFGFLIKLSITTFILFACWELVNISFNAYMSIGCLHRGHTLSELSTDPVGTLLTGLKSEKLFTKLTAFQELAYISKAEDNELRMAIYNRNNRREYVWGEILQECEKVIKTNNINILRSITQITPAPVVDQKKTIRDQHIFGREYYPQEFERRDDDLFKSVPIVPVTEPSFLDTNMIPLVVKNVKEFISLAKEYYLKFVTSGFGMPFRHTAIREAEFLCPTPVIVGNAIIAVSLIGTHSYNEDKKGTVSSTITDVLEILEKSVSACGRFVQRPPEHLVETEEDNLITMLHELSMNAFFEVTVQFSSVLKDLVLSPDVYRLVNWTLETAMNDGQVE